MTKGWKSQARSWQPQTSQQFAMDVKKLLGGNNSGFGGLEVNNWQRPHFIHSTLVDLEGRRHPAAAGTLLTSPAEGAQL